MGLPAPVGLHRAQNVDDFLHVVAVDVANFPAERRELLGKVAWIAYLLCIAVNLQAVAIDDCDQVVELVVRGEHRRLPNLAFLAFAIAEEGEHAMFVAIEPQARRKAACD